MIFLFKWHCQSLSQKQIFDTRRRTPCPVKIFQNFFTWYLDVYVKPSLVKFKNEKPNSSQMD